MAGSPGGSAVSEFPVVCIKKSPLMPKPSPPAARPPSTKVLIVMHPDGGRVAPCT